MTIRKIILLVISLAALTGCSRTMMLNQTATTLEKKEKELVFRGGAGVTMYGYMPSPLLSAGAQYRMGFKDNLELQFFYDCNLHIPINGMVQMSNHFDWTLKYRAVNRKRVQFALLPYFGVINKIGAPNYEDSYWSLPNGVYVPITLALGPELGLKTIISHDLRKKPVSLYYGMGVDISNNLLLLFNLARKERYHNSYTGESYYLNQGPLPFMNITAGLSFGVELRKALVTRHEIGATVNMNFIGSYAPGERRFQVAPTTLMPKFTISYMFAVGTRYKGKLNELNRTE